MKHYYNPRSRAVSTMWMLEELGVEHEKVLVDLEAGEQQLPDYRAINPMGKVPTLVDGDVVVTEVAAICAYLADKYIDKGLAPALGSIERGRYFRYLFVPGTTLEPFFSVKSAGLVHPQPSSVGWGDEERVLATVESMTPQSDWALGERFTAADVVFGGTLDFAVRFGWMEASARVSSYVDRLRARPAYEATHGGFGG